MGALSTKTQSIHEQQRAQKSSGGWTQVERQPWGVPGGEPSLLVVGEVTVESWPQAWHYTQKLRPEMLQAAFGCILVTPFLPGTLAVLTSLLRGWQWYSRVAGLAPGTASAHSSLPLSIYCLSALLFWDIKQVAWEVARGLDA